MAADGVGKLTVPVGDVLVGDTGCYIEHDDAALAVDVVSISQTAEFLLARRIPHIELDLTQILNRHQHLRFPTDTRFCFGPYRAEAERMDFDTKSCDVFLLEFSSQMTFDKSGL